MKTDNDRKKVTMLQHEINMFKQTHEAWDKAKKETAVWSALLNEQLYALYSKGHLTGPQAAKMTGMNVATIYQRIYRTEGEVYKAKSKLN